MGAVYRFDLGPYIEKYGLVNYLETGTGTGSCLDWARKYNFQKLYSIELDEEFVNNLKHIEKSDFRVNLINDYSTKALTELLPKLSNDEPLLIWLDSHFIGNPDHHKCSYEESISSHGQASFPLEEELQILKKYRDISRDVIILDDYCLYAGDDLTEWSRQNPFKYRKMSEELNINLSVGFIYDVLDLTRNFEIDHQDQGYLIALPKKEEICIHLQ